MFGNILQAVIKIGTLYVGHISNEAINRNGKKDM